MMKIAVLDAFAADQGQLSWDALQASGEVTTYPRSRPDEVVDRAREAAAVLTNKVVFDRAVLAKLPKLRYVGLLATGTNAVELAACRERGIAVTNVPGYSTHSVAQHTFAFVLHFTQRIAAHDAAVRSGRWPRSPDFSFTVSPLAELCGKTLCILGFGAIGRAVAAIARAFGMRIVTAAVPGSTATERLPLAEALPQSDFVTLHCPLTPTTARLVSDPFLSQMKQSAVLINTARGGLVDQTALSRALSEGRIAGAALDVLVDEPPPTEDPLLALRGAARERLVVTPHIAWATLEARRRLIASAGENLAAYCRGERKNRVD